MDPDDGHCHFRPEFLEDFAVAGTIQDYVVSMLCGLDRCVMTPQNAASWGFFNTSSNQWNVDMYVGIFLFIRIKFALTLSQILNA